VDTDDGVEQTLHEQSHVDDESREEKLSEEAEEEKERNQQQNLFNVQPRANNYGE